MVNVLPQFAQYAWFFPVGTVVAFVMGAGMGANELSSNWGTVFGSRVLKLWQVVLLAAIFEFTGAATIGESVASAIKDGVIDRKKFIAYKPELLMLAMLVVLISAAIWLIVANYFAMPISDSQTTVLSLVGVGLAFNPSSVIVGTSVFEKKGLLKIISAWVVSPLSAMLIGIILYTAIKKFLLVHSSTVKRALAALPAFIFLTVFVNFWFFLLETDIQPWGEELEWWQKLVGGIIAGVIVTIICQFTYIKWLAARIEEIRAKETRANSTASFLELIDGQVGEPKSGDDELEVSDELRAPEKYSEGFVPKIDRLLASHAFTSYLVKDYHAEAMLDPAVKAAHDEAEVFPEEIEFLFSHLLIVTACFKSFAHGASDVGNTIGPLSGIIEILTKGTTADKVTFPEWIKLLGAASMLVGIITYGWKTLVTLGVKLTKLSPAKGLAIDLASALVVIITAYLKIPISSTQTQVGAIIGVSLISGKKSMLGSTNWKTMLTIAFVWVMTLVVSLGLAFGLFSFIAWSPKM